MHLPPAAFDTVVASRLRVGIISDTHIPEAASALWPSVYRFLEGVDIILHAGDMHDIALIDELQRIKPTFVARGNGEDGSGGRPVQPGHELAQHRWVINLAGVEVGLIHDFYLGGSKAAIEKRVATFFGPHSPQVIVCGHTHVEQILNAHDLLIVNPGSVTLPHNLTPRLGTVALLTIEDQRPSAALFQLTETGVEPI